MQKFELADKPLSRTCIGPGSDAGQAFASPSRKLRLRPSLRACSRAAYFLPLGLPLALPPALPLLLLLVSEASKRSAPLEMARLIC